ncbi:MAG: 2-C-methyl-D-erythritol 4-phosphate cytidylyltransferase, partial [Planctomycetota bacterium]
TIAIEAFASAERSGLQATDDSQILEAAGVTVRLVPSTAPNPKITWERDLELVRALLRDSRPQSLIW